MINNLQDEFYILESKQAQGAKIHANIRCDLEGEKCSKTFFNMLQRQNMQNQTISELHPNNEKSRYSNNKSTKKFKKVLNSAIRELLNKIPNNKKIFNEHFNLCEADIALDEVVESINSQKNNRSSGN